MSCVRRRCGRWAVGELPVVLALLERGVRVRVAFEEQVRTFAATAEVRLPDVGTVAQMAGSARLLNERMSRQENDERARLLLSRRQELEMQAQEERLRVAEDAPLQVLLERHLVLLDRQARGLARAAAGPDAGGLAPPGVGGARSVATSRRAARRGPGGPPARNHPCTPPGWADRLPALTTGGAPRPQGRGPRASQFVSTRVTAPAASCCTKWPAPGSVTSVRSRSTHCQVSFRPPGNRASSSNPWMTRVGA